MKKISILLLFLVVFAFFAAPAGAIIGGDFDTEHTNVGAIVLKWPAQDYQLARLCTATLIEPKVLVTAAHCIERLGDNVVNEPFFITFKQDALFGDPEVDEEYLAVQGFKYHPEFITHEDTHDIGLVYLEDPVPVDWGIESQDLPDLGYMEEVTKDIAPKDQSDLELIIVGYGAQEPYQKNDPMNFLVAIRKFGYVTFRDLTPFMIKTNTKFDNDKTWYGDSGGPIFYYDEDLDDEIMIGVRGGGGDGHYRLDTKIALEWIAAEKDNPPE